MVDPERPDHVGTAQEMDCHQSFGRCGWWRADQSRSLAFSSAIDLYMKLRRGILAAS